MEITKEHKDRVKRQVVETIVGALEKKELATTELPDIGTFVIENIETVATKDEMMNFLQKLSAKWRIFSIVLVLESGEWKMQQEKKIVNESLSLLRQGDVDDALKLAKTITKGDK